MQIVGQVAKQLVRLGIFAWISNECDPDVGCRRSVLADSIPLYSCLAVGLVEQLGIVRRLSDGTTRLEPLNRLLLVELASAKVAILRLVRILLLALLPRARR